MNAPHPFRAQHGHLAVTAEALTDRAADLALVVDHHGYNAFTDELLMARIFRRLGWEMLTDEALEMLAREYEANAALRERMMAENRAIANMAGAR